MCIDTHLNSSCGRGPGVGNTVLYSWWVLCSFCSRRGDGEGIEERWGGLHKKEPLPEERFGH
jgi:hypothetical protein